jgi:hypothetical protein
MEHRSNGLRSQSTPPGCSPLGLPLEKRLGPLDGDKSPAESGENSPHSITPCLRLQPRDGPVPGKDHSFLNAGWSFFPADSM